MGSMPVFEDAQSAAAHKELRNDWERAEVGAIYRTALPELVFRAQTIHRQFHAPDRVQTCQLISIKTGGCPEDCAYCPQSAHYESGVEAGPGGQGIRECSRDGARSFRSGHGSVLHARHVVGRAGWKAERGWPDGVQS